METLLKILTRGPDNYRSKFKNFWKVQKKWNSFSKWSTGHVENSFDNFAGSFSQVVQDILPQNPKSIEKNCCWKKFPQKVHRRLECNIDKTDEAFFSELRFLPLEPEVKLTLTNYCKTNPEVLWTRGMQFWQRCWKFSQEVWTIITQSPKTTLKKPQKKVTFLNVLLWTRKL